MWKTKRYRKLVDDDETFRYALSELLSKEFEVLKSFGVKDALEKLKKEKSKLERLKNTCPSNKRSSYEKEIEEIKRKIKQAETNCNHTYNALLIAKRS